jgi:hypothetical protein
MTDTTESNVAAATTAGLMNPAPGRALAARTPTEERMERARADGVSLVGPDGMLARLTDQAGARVDSGGGDDRACGI